MKFKGDPDLVVVVHRPMVGEPKAFRFDNSGTYETAVPSMIKRLSARFAVVEEPTHRCKKCDFETENKGILMAHYRDKHPKEQ
jgi:hypothetical protein